MTANGPLPPPDNARPAVVTAGEIVPFALVCKAGFSACQRPPRQARVGWEVSVRVYLPPGLTVVDDVGVVSAETATGLPVASARASAWPGVSGPGDEVSPAACVCAA
jgi:hypothetical protein